MNESSLWSTFIGACLINNFVLAYFLGICPFLGVSAKTNTAVRMGGAVTFVMVVSSMAAYGIHALLAMVDAPYLELISFIAVIASTVQLLEMFIKKVSPVLFRALGIFLTHHHQLCDSGSRPVPNQPRLRIPAVDRIRAGRRRRIHSGLGVDGWSA
jgi:Na+-translocating ferredoxin:NAD+ oxidoreductase RnfA subunit